MLELLRAVDLGSSAIERASFGDESVQSRFTVHSFASLDGDEARADQGSQTLDIAHPAPKRISGAILLGCKSPGFNLLSSEGFKIGRKIDVHKINLA